ncbi:HlyD family secretion protein [Sphingomonas laterariae]|uniref:HlyD family secretion protein n=1 Tax=Edaphosphingomonas laterariae TaxID=861865 RepID=A0A239HDG8_9SPHN|nr:secretion protein HlyD [Sphingomonas laterariae]SNS79449.1 HlyD family secretion protein [Sphingomonas laterariae]
MNRRRLIPIAIIAILVVAAILTRGFGLFDSGRGGTLRLSGNVDIRSVDLGFRVGGRIAEMPVDEGAKVAAGTVLARLDTRPLNDALNAASAEIGVSEAELTKRINGNRPQDIARAEAEAAAARATLAKANEDYQRRAELVKTGAVSQALYDASKAEYLAAQAQLRAADEALSLQRAGARREDVAAARAQRAAAIAHRDKAATDLADATITAPAAGTILTRAREPGAIVQPGEAVFTLTIDRPMRVRAYISEPDLGRISPGMKVEVAVDGNPRRYAGTIGFISPTAEFTPKTVETRDLRSDLVYRIRVIVTDPDDALRQGQPVTVTVPDARPAAD